MSARRWNARVPDSIFSLVGAVVSTLRRDGLPEEALEFLRAASHCGADEAKVLKLAGNYVEIGDPKRREGGR